MSASSYALTLALAAAPWLWFAARDAHVVIDFLAASLPVWMGGAAIALVAAGVAFGEWCLLVPAVSWAAATVVAVAGPWRRRAADPTGTAALRLAAVNVLYLNEAPPEAVADDVVAAGADLVVVVELTPAIHDALVARHPHAWGRPVSGAHYGVGVYGSVPFAVVAQPDLGGADVSAVVVDVETPAGALRVYGLHMRPPWRPGHLTSRQHLEAVHRLRALVEAESTPTVVAGDLNLPDRCGGYRVLASAFVDAMRAGVRTGPTYVTWRWRVAFFRIDHVFLPRGWTAAAPRRIRVRGSDHLGIVATVGPAAGS